jgi:hypothetical protein
MCLYILIINIISLIYLDLEFMGETKSVSKIFLAKKAKLIKNQTAKSKSKNRKTTKKECFKKKIKIIKFDQFEPQKLTSINQNNKYLLHILK